MSEKLPSSSDIDVAKQSARGSLILFAGNFLATAINAVAIIIVARLLGPDGYGAYSLSLLAPGLLILFAGLGVSVAITRYSAYYSSIGKTDEAKRFTRSAILFLLLFGVALSALNYAFADFLSSALILRPGFTGYVQESSLYILGATLLSTVTAAATGWNMMGLASASQVLQSVVKLAVGPGLILAGFGVSGAIDGHVLSFLVAGFAGIAVLYLVKLRRLPIRPWNLAAELAEMIRFGFPAFAGLLISGLASYYVAILLAAIASNTVFGFYQAASNFALPIALVSTSVGGALFPAFSILAGAGGDLKVAFGLSVKYISYLIVPIALFLVASSPVLVPAFYGPSFSQASPYLQLLAIAYLPTAVGLGILPVFFNGAGKTRLSLYLYLVNSVLIVVAAPLLALQLGLGVNGLIYALLVSNVGGLALGLALARRSLSASADLRSVVMILLSAAISAAVVTFLPVLLSPPLTLLLQLAVFTACYLTLAPILRGIDREDVGRLRLVLGGMKAIGAISGWVLGYEMFIIERVGAK
jgi:O-antigen/teichoic acid export membrane protein